MADVTGLGQLGSALGDIADIVSEPFEAIAGVVKACLGDFADLDKLLGGDILASFQNLINTTAQFVAALNPSLMEAFGRTIKDLQATIGVAFEPIFQVINDTFKRVAGIILPVMQQLRPVIAELSNSISRILIATVRLFANVLQALIPVLKLLTDVVALYADYVQALSTVWLALIDVAKDMIATFLGSGDVKDAMKDLKDMVHEVIKQLILFVATLAKMLGANDFVKALITRLEQAINPGKERGAVANTGPPQVTGLPELIKQFTAAAAGAQGGGKLPAEETNDWLKEILDQVKVIDIKGATDALNENLKTLAGVITEAVGAIRTVIGLLTPKGGDEAAAKVRTFNRELEQNPPQDFQGRIGAALLQWIERSTTAAPIAITAPNSPWNTPDNMNPRPPLHRPGQEGI